MIYAIAILCGVIAGLVSALFRIKRENQHLNIQLDHALEEMEEAQIKLEGK